MWPDGVDNSIWLVKEFEVKHDIIGHLYALVPYITFLLQDWVEEIMEEIDKFT